MKKSKRQAVENALLKGLLHRIKWESKAALIRRPNLGEWRNQMEIIDKAATLGEKVQGKTENSLWPEPTEDEPSMEQLEAWGFDGVVEATDGCIVEPDGICSHGYPSWFIHLEVI